MSARRRWLRWVVCSLAATMLPLSIGAHAQSFEAFFTAVKRNDVPKLEQLHAMGFDLNTINEKGQHALHLALREPSLKVAEYLARHPAVKVEVRNPQDESSLMLAVLKGHLEVARLLIERDADVNKTGWAPLHYAATYAGPNAVEQVTLLLEHHAYIDAESPNGTTPLMMAAQYGSVDVVKLLLQEGADSRLTNEQKLSAMDFALRASRPSTAEVIAEHIRLRQPRGRW